MAKKRTLFNNPAFATLAGVVLNAYGELVLRTSQFRLQADPAVDLLVREQGLPVIYALWHCHVFFMPMLRRYERRPVAVLLSSHRDARIVGVAARMRGVELVEGSSTRGGMKAYRQLLARLHQGQSVCVTPDGPKGPREKVKTGVLHLAKQSGCAIVPVALASSRVHRLKSWDRTLLPLPFSKAIFELGPPFYAGSEIPLDTLQHQLHGLLQDAGAAAEARIGAGPP